MRLLTENEVAEVLRCSTSKVKRLRLDGKLAYLPGRPVFVKDDDLNAYVESTRCQALPPSPEMPKAASQGFTGTKTEMESVAERVRRARLKRKLISRHAR